MESRYDERQTYPVKERGKSIVLVNSSSSYLSGSTLNALAAKGIKIIDRQTACDLANHVNTYR